MEPEINSPKTGIKSIFNINQKIKYLPSPSFWHTKKKWMVIIPVILIGLGAVGYGIWRFQIQKSITSYQGGVTEYYKQNAIKSISEMEAKIAKSSEDILTLKKLAEAYSFKGDTVNSDKINQKIQALNDKYYNSAKEIYDKGDFLGAIEAYTKLLNLNPTNISARIEFAQNLFSSGKTESAINILNAGLELDISDEDKVKIYTALVDIYNKTSQFDLAQKVGQEISNLLDQTPQK